MMKFDEIATLLASPEFDESILGSPRFKATQIKSILTRPDNPARYQISLLANQQKII